MSAQIGLIDPQSSPHASGGLDILSKAVSMIVLPEDQNGDLPMKKNGSSWKNGDVTWNKREQNGKKATNTASLWQEEEKTLGIRKQ